VYVENFNPYSPSLHNVLANGLDNAHLDFFQFFVGGITNSPGVLAIGGPCSLEGNIIKNGAPIFLRPQTQAAQF
jgi:hypothetical protein